LLEIKSRKASDDCSPGISDPWLQFSHRFCSVELRRSASSTNQNNYIPTNANVEIQPNHKEHVDLAHPLAQTEAPESPAPQTNSIRLTQATAESIAVHLGAKDLDGIRVMMREIVLKSVVPFVEKQIKQLKEVVDNRKSRSLFSGAKRWFGGNKPSSGVGTSVVYNKDAPELQVRKLADLYFMMKMYKSAYNYYYISKKDFQTDEAWPYYAPAVELTALAMFMLAGSDTGKKYRPDYMEDAITKYLTLCQTPEFAVRATLFDALCLKQQGLFEESANSYIRMTNELSDLRSAMMLEQAAYCYLLNAPPNVRKYGFHIVLAGYRFTKTGSCKKHAARLYTQGSQVYDGKGWLLSTEHILYSLGHQKFMLKDFASSSEFFNDLMAVSTGRNPLQQMVHLREYFLVHHARFKEDKSVVVITVPNMDSQQIAMSLRKPETAPPKHWQAIERCIREGVSGQEMLVMSRTSQQIFNNQTTNHLNPQGVVGEAVYVTVPLQNNFNTPLLITKSFLLWRFTDKDGQTFSNDKRNSSEEGAAEIETIPVDSLTLESGGHASLILSVRSRRVGVLSITGVEYSLKALFPDREPTDHQIRGKQYFQISGPRLNTIKDHKSKVVYGQDLRLTVNISAPQPLLSARLNIPDSLFSGELRCVEMELQNAGPVSLTNLHLVSTSPGILSLGKPRPMPFFEFPLLAKNEAPLKIIREDGTVAQTRLDMLAVPLARGELAGGASVNVPIWVRGQTDQGLIEEDVYFYYEKGGSSDPKPSYRILHAPVRMKIQDCLVGTASSNNITMHSNKPTSNISIRLKNVCKEGPGSLQNISITQVTLVSCNRELISVEGSASCGSVPRDQTVTLALKSVIIDEVNVCDIADHVRELEKKDLPGGDLRFSSLTSANNKGHAIQSPPFLDFIKSSFRFNIGRKFNPPFLKGDIIVIMWRSEGPQPVLGQTVLPVQLSPPSPDAPLPSHQPVLVKLDYTKQLFHDFSRSPFVAVSVRVEFRRAESDPSGTLVQFCLKDLQQGMKWTGVTDGVSWIQEDSLVLNLGVNVSRSGVFHLDNFQFRAKKMASYDPGYFENCAEEFSSLDLCFTVLQP